MNAGSFIKSTSLLDDTVFENTIIFIAEYNEKGAMGFVINHKFFRGLTDLEEFKQGRPFPLYDGGPVDKEHLYFIHQRPDLIPGGTYVIDNVYQGGDFQMAVKHINSGVLTAADIKIFIGYCGWDYEELDAELAEGSWHMITSENLFAQI